jgi:hypothetical protein
MQAATGANPKIKFLAHANPAPQQEQRRYTGDNTTRQITGAKKHSSPKRSNEKHSDQGWQTLVPFG